MLHRGKQRRTRPDDDVCLAIASRQQTADIGALSRAIERIDNDTQENAVSVEETTAVAAAMHQEVIKLLQAVDSLKLGERSQTLPAPSSTTPAGVRPAKSWSAAA